MNSTGIAKRLTFLVLAIFTLALVLAACGGDDDDGDTASTGSGTAPTATSDSGSESTPAGEEDEEASSGNETEKMASGDLSGEINIDGSSTVFPISQGVAEEFQREHSDVNISVGFSGTGGGFEKFCAGETDISDASRAISEEEIAACQENGIEYTEFRVAIDGLSVVVNPENDWVECLTVDQLAQMFQPESEITQWSDLDSSWPEEDIGFYIPGTDSGTFDYFTEAIAGEEGASRSDVTASEDDNVLVQGITGEQYSIGYFGYAYYVENQDRLKVLGIDNGDGCVQPSDETVQSGEYAPLSRPLYIYVSHQAVQEKPAVAEFVRFYFTDGVEVVPQVGYVQLNDEAYQENLSTLDGLTS